MPQQLFSSVESGVGQTANFTRSVTRADDGRIAIELRNERVINGAPVTEVHSVIEFTAAEWASITEYPFDPPATRIVTREVFLNRILITERIFFEALKESTNDTIRRTAKVWWDEVMARPTIDLDSQRVQDGFAFVKAMAVPTLWATSEVADARIATIRGL